MPVPGLTRAAIRIGHDGPTYEHGERDQRDGCVTDVCEIATPNGVAITGKVNGPSPREVYVALELGPAGPIVESDCTCEVGFDCRHAVAVLLEYIERGETEAPPSAPRHDAPGALLRRFAETMALANAAGPVTWPAHVRERLLYVLDVIPTGEGTASLRVALAEAHAAKHGGYARIAPMMIRRVLDDYRPAFVLQSDVELVRCIVESAAGGLACDDAVVLPCAASAPLELLLASGRCHWRSVGAPLERGGVRKAHPTWRLAADGCQEIDWRLERPAHVVFPVTPPWYLDAGRGVCGPVDAGLPLEHAAHLVKAPRVPPEGVERVARALAEAAPGLPSPTHVDVIDLPPTRPVPCLLLHADAAADEHSIPGTHRTYAHPRSARARLRFRYGVFLIDAGDSRDTLARARAGQVERLARDRDAEATALARLREAGWLEAFERRAEADARDDLTPSPSADAADARRVSDWSPADRDASAGWVRFLTLTRRRLEAEGWDITVGDDFPYTVVPEEAWYADLRPEASSRDVGPGASGDWFSLDLGIVVDGERLPLLPLLKGWLAGAGTRPHVDALEPGAAIEIAMPGGRRLILPAERVRAILETLIELYDAETRLDGGARLKLPRWRAMAIETPDGIEWQGAESLRAAAARLRAAGGLDRVPVPRGFNAELRAYQRDGLDWLQFLRAHRLAGVLADDMGLGKTVQLLAHLLLEKEAGRADRPSLVVAPTSLLGNWRREAAAFAPALRVVTWHGPERRALLERKVLDCDLVLTTYTLLARDAEWLAAMPFHLAVLDEAQFIKNARTHAARAARGLDARHRLCLTGTPLENHLGEAWSLFDFLLPGLLGTEREFKRLFRVPIERDGNADRHRQLRRRVAPFLLRRSKNDVLAELPPKTEILRTVELEGAQRDLYESIRLAMHREVRDAVVVRGLGRSRIIVLDALLKLRQVCCDPRLVDLEQARCVRESAKLDLLMTLLPNMLEEGRRVLLFSQFTSMLALIETAVAEEGIEFVKLTGQTRNRADPVDRFQRGDVPLFLISLKAGGTGLNLTAADTVIHYDPWWNPAVEAQATDRAHRIGQHQPVFVYKLVAQGTVEERILALQAGKRALAEGLLADGSGSVGLSPEDIDALFAPLE
jgi:superfamily II DNA or RNA helicase